MDLEEVVRCPLCGSVEFSPPFSAKDYTTTGEMFHVKHCRSCSLGITSPRPPERDSARYYKSEAYISHTGGSKALIDRIYLILRSFTIRWKYSIVRPYLKGNGLLDVGCGTGSFLHYVHRQQHYAFGVEPSASARRAIPPTLAIAPSLSELPRQKFDAITLWHVIEHIYSLRETIQTLKQHLAPGGALFLAVPNHQSVDAQQYGEYWAAYDVPRHLWHFNQQSMAALLREEGMKITQVIPMKLDAYYVSLLSERYSRSGQLGIHGLFRAVKNAFRSNRSARKDGNYSSLIFVVQP